MDADNCYNPIAYPIASLVFQSFSIPKEACVFLLKIIQDMKFFLRTGFADSKEFASATRDIKT